jgi:hypothetical protein
MVIAEGHPALNASFQKRRISPQIETDLMELAEGLPPDALSRNLTGLTDRAKFKLMFNVSGSQKSPRIRRFQIHNGYAHSTGRKTRAPRETVNFRIMQAAQ